LVFSLILCCSAINDDVCSVVPASSPYQLSVCTMVYNEAHYIEEWLAYHLLLKVDHFFVYDDDSTDNLSEVLAPYIKLGVVTLIPWGKTKQTIPEETAKKWVPAEPVFTRPQRFAIADCLFNHANESAWFGIWDVDEFLVLNGSFADIHEFMPYAKARGDDYQIPITTFGTAGHEQTPNGWVIQDFQMRNNRTMFGINYIDDKFSGKSMYKMNCGLPNVHVTYNLRPGCRKSTNGWRNIDGSRDPEPLVINHYAVKSWEHFKEKMIKWHFGLVREDFDKYEEHSNQIYDDSMEKFVQPVATLVGCMKQQR